MRTFVLSVILSVTSVSPVCAHAQTRKPASRPATRTASSSAAKTPQPATASAAFNTAGLQNEDDFLHIYSGEFSKVRNRNGMQVSTLTGAYMNTFAVRCAAYLPANKVPITELVCAKSFQTVDKNGLPAPGPEGCSEYKKVNTGRFADPALSAAEDNAAAGAARQNAREMAGILTGRTRNPLDMVTHLTAGTPAISSDVGALFQKNACDSPGMKKFQANLIRFANGEEPMHFTRASTSPSPAPDIEPIPAAPKAAAPNRAHSGADNGAPATPTTRTDHNPAAPARIDGVYDGTYTCAQGPGTLKLSLAAGPGNSLTGLFTFYVPPRSHDRAYSYRLSGTYDAESGQFRLNPLAWETPPPPGYVMVGMDGTLDRGKVAGKITFGTCGGFEATRVASKAAKAGPH
jgi:hypothetical protein